MPVRGGNAERAGCVRKTQYPGAASAGDRQFAAGSQRGYVWSQGSGRGYQGWGDGAGKAGGTGESDHRIAGAFTVNGGGCTDFCEAGCDAGDRSGSSKRRANGKDEERKRGKHLKKARIHFMGIGGQGISAVGQKGIKAGGYNVEATGWDLDGSAITPALEPCGGALE